MEYTRSIRLLCLAIVVNLSSVFSGPVRIHCRPGEYANTDIVPGNVTCMRCPEKCQDEALDDRNSCVLSCTVPTRSSPLPNSLPSITAWKPEITTDHVIMSDSSTTKDPTTPRPNATSNSDNATTISPTKTKLPRVEDESLTFKVGMISLGVLVALGILIICGIIYWRRERNSGEKNDQKTAQKTDQYHGNGEVKLGIQEQDADEGRTHKYREYFK